MIHSRSIKNKEMTGYIKKHMDMYLLMIPGLIYLLVFKILPLAGISIAFVDYNIFASSSPLKAMLASPFVGLDHFADIFKREEFLHALGNTFIISGMKIFFLFPLPIITALILNGIGRIGYVKTVQTIIYLPHFLSWVVVAGIFMQILSMDGMVNHVIAGLGWEKVKFYMDNRLFRGVLVFTDGWKSVGWGSIIYFAALASIDPQLYEAAIIDGATKWQRLWNVTLPGLLSTIVLMFILRLGQVMEAGFTQILVMYNPTVYESSDIIQTFVYRVGLGRIEFSMGTAVGLFNSLVSMSLILTTNFISVRTVNRGIW